MSTPAGVAHPSRVFCSEYPSGLRPEIKSQLHTLCFYLLKIKMIRFKHRDIINGYCAPKISMCCVIKTFSENRLIDWCYCCYPCWWHVLKLFFDGVWGPSSETPTHFSPSKVADFYVFSQNFCKSGLISKGFSTTKMPDFTIFPAIFVKWARGALKYESDIQVPTGERK